MTKREVLKYCEEKAKEGWLTHKMILELYDVEDEVPDDIIDLICHKLESPRPLIVFGSVEGLKKFNQAVEDFFLTLVHGEILDKHRNNNIRS